jgi:iron(III) transport system substrate-binding protein
MTINKSLLVLILNIFALGFFVSSAQAEAKKEVWVYTSVYKEFIAPIEAAFEKKYPHIDIQVFQGGSEKLQAKVEAELISKRPQADFLMMSDPFWAADLAKRGLATSENLAANKTNYYSAMVLIAHKDFPKDKRPTSFGDLTKPAFLNLVQMGSPLESGTMFSAVAILDKRYGWNFFEALKKNKVAASGGNSTVIQKVESGEKKIGIVLLENALASQKRGSPIDIVYPTDGAILIPSTQVVLKSSPHQKEAAEFSDFIASKEGQSLLRNGYMYSVRNDVPAPEGALPLANINKNTQEWTEQVVSEIAGRSKEIKSKFSETILE